MTSIVITQLRDLHTIATEVLGLVMFLLVANRMVQDEVKRKKQRGTHGAVPPKEQANGRQG